jgi:undecaprenyl-diphosphatase
VSSGSEVTGAESSSPDVLLATPQDVQQEALGEVRLRDLHEPRVVRTPVDISHLAGFLGLFLVGLALATFADRTMAGFEADLVELVANIPTGVNLAILLATQVLYLVAAIGTPIALWVARRRRTVGMGALAIVLAMAALIGLERVLPTRTGTPPPDIDTDPLLDEGWPSTPVLSAFAAALVVVGPEVSRRWRRASWLFLVVLAGMRIITADDVPLDVLLAVAVGGVVGTVLLLGFGRTVYMVTPAAVREALVRGGLPVDLVAHTDVAASRATPFLADLSSRVPLEGPAAARGEVAALPQSESSEAQRAAATAEPQARTTEDRGVVPVPVAPAQLFVKVLGEAEQEADRLYRAYRRVRLKDVGDDTPYASPRRAAATEAMLGMLAERHDVRTPPVRAVANLGSESVLVAYDFIPGRTLDTVPAEEITDAVLHDLWQQVAALRAAGIAHRDLQLSSVVLGDDGRCWLVDFSFGEPAAQLAALDGDLAETLAATYAAVGAQRAVAAAVDVMGPQPVADAMVRLVPAALSRGTRTAVKHQPDGLKPLVDEVSRVTGVEEPQFAQVERVKPRVLLIGVMLAVAVYVLLPQLANMPKMWDAVQAADWAWVPAVLFASFLTYVGAGMGLVGGTPGRVPVNQAGLVAVASTFVGLVTPPGLSHMGLNVRFLQKRGFSAPVAVSATAAKEVAVGVVHVLLVVIFALWAGRTTAIADEIPSAGVIAAVAGVLLVVVGVAVATPKVRQFARDIVIPAVKRSLVAMAEVARSPAKLTLLLVGVTLLPLGYAACLYFSVEAFGGGASFAAVALVYLTVGSVASVAPTPGGIGAVEAVLLGALAALGIASAEALAAVFMFRLATFWIPIPIGAVSFRWLTAREIL